MRITIAVLIPTLLLVSCKNQSGEIRADHHFNSLFHLDSNGVTGTDGTISIPLSDGRSVFLMGDSFLGKVINGKRDSTPNVILGNVFITVSKDQKSVKNYYRGSADAPETFLTTLGDNPSVEWIWPGHGFEHNGILHIFMLNYTSDFWAFRGTDYIRLKLPGFEKLSHERFQPSLAKGVRWGHAVVKDDPYVYIYGGDFVDSIPDDKAGVHVIRARISEHNELAGLSYFDGEDWSSDPNESKEMAGLNISISEQFSVFKHQVKFVLISHERGYKSTKIYSYIADSPAGPWRNEKMLYQTNESLQNSNIFTYNAMAHPQYIKDGELLLSYNMTSSNVSDIYTDATIYRPRFLRCPLDKILNEN